MPWSDYTNLAQFWSCFVVASELPASWSTVSDNRAHIPVWCDVLNGLSCSILDAPQHPDKKTSTRIVCLDTPSVTSPMICSWSFTDQVLSSDCSQVTMLRLHLSGGTMKEEKSLWSCGSSTPAYLTFSSEDYHDPVKKDKWREIVEALYQPGK